MKGMLVLALTGCGYGAPSSTVSLSRPCWIDDDTVLFTRHVRTTRPPLGLHRFPDGGRAHVDRNEIELIQFSVQRRSGITIARLPGADRERAHGIARCGWPVAVFVSTADGVNGFTVQQDGSFRSVDGLEVRTQAYPVPKGWRLRYPGMFPGNRITIHAPDGEQIEIQGGGD